MNFHKIINKDLFKEIVTNNTKIDKNEQERNKKIRKNILTKIFGRD